MQTWPLMRIRRKRWSSCLLSAGRSDGDQNEEDFTNGGGDYPSKHLKFFLLVFSKLKKKLNKERIKPKRRLQPFKNGLQLISLFIVSFV